MGSAIKITENFKVDESVPAEDSMSENNLSLDVKSNLNSSS